MKWRIQFFLLVMVMVCFVIGGIHLAEKGIHRVDGMEKGPKQSFHITRANDGKLEMTVLGRQYSLEHEMMSPDYTSQIPSKSGQVEVKEESLNLASQIGNQVGTWVTFLSQKLMGWLLG